MRLSSYVLAKAIFLTRIASFFDLLCDLFRVVGATKTQFSGQNIFEVAIPYEEKIISRILGHVENVDWFSIKQ